MHLGLSAILKRLDPRRPSERKREKAEIQLRADHEFIKGHIAQRGPCPGLNALSNHGFLFVFTSTSYAVPPAV